MTEELKEAPKPEYSPIIFYLMIGVNVVLIISVFIFVAANNFSFSYFLSSLEMFLAVSLLVLLSVFFYLAIGTPMMSGFVLLLIISLLYHFSMGYFNTMATKYYGKDKSDKLALSVKIIYAFIFVFTVFSAVHLLV